jgi:hypothetical protein
MRGDKVLDWGYVRVTGEHRCDYSSTVHGAVRRVEGGYHWLVWSIGNTLAKGDAATLAGAKSACDRAARQCLGGRPVVGPKVEVRIPSELLALVDADAGVMGITRAEWIRSAVAAAVPVAE